MKEQIIKLVMDHLVIVLLAIFHLLSVVTLSIVEYEIGKNKNIPENSLLEILRNKIWGVQK